MGSYLCVPIVRPGPLRPRVIPTTRSRRPREQLKVDYGLGTVAHRSADTVVARVTTADDDDVFALGINVPAFFQLGVEERLGVQLE